MEVPRFYTEMMILSVVFLLVGLCNADCQSSNKPGILRFTTEMNVVDFAYKWRYKELDCCASGYDELIWYHQSYGMGDKWSNFPFTWGNDTNVGLKHSNRTISVDSIPDAAKGIFKCVAKNLTTGNKIIHKIKFGVDGKYGRYEMIPFRPPAEVCINSTIRRISCSADFGHLDKFESFVYWSYIQNKTNENDVAEYPRFEEYMNMNISQNCTLQNANTVKNAELILSGVTRAADGATLKCRVYSTLKDGEDAIFETVLRICDQHKVKSIVKLWTVLLSLVASVLVVVLLLIALYSCRRKIRTLIPSAYYSLAGGTDPNLGSNYYHALIHYCENDPNDQLAREIRDDIRKASEGYHLCIQEPGERIMQSIGELANKSATMIIISPSGENQDQEPNMDRNQNQNDTDIEMADDVFPPNQSCDALDIDGVGDQKEDDQFLQTNCVSSSSIDIFQHQLNSMLVDNFKDHKTEVTLIVSKKSNVIPNKLKGYKRIVAGEKNSKTRRKCIDELILRMPLPLSNKTVSITRHRDRNQRDQRCLLGSTDSTGSV